MAKIFPTGGRRQIVQNVVLVSGDEVQGETLRYDLPETHPAPADDTSLAAAVAETHPTPLETGILGVLLTADEILPDPQEAVALAAAVAEQHRAGTDAASIAAFVQETMPVPAETVAALIAVLSETSPAPTEDVSGTEARAQVNETSPHPTGAVDVAVIVAESHRAATDDAALGATVNETHRPAQDDVSGTVASFQSNETHPHPVESVTAAVAVVSESVRAADDDAYTKATGNVWPDTVVSQTNFTNPASAVDKDANTSAVIQATSSGLGNTTSNTTTGNITISAVKPAITDLTITSCILGVKTQIGAGSALSATVNMLLEYSLNDGASWTSVATITAVSEGVLTRTVDLTAIVGGDWNKVDQMRFRASGSVTSGPGVVTAVTCTFQLFYARLEIVAERTYP